MDYMLSNRKNYLLIALIAISLIAVLVLAYYLLKKEDPRYTAYSCSQFLSFSEQALLSDKKISVLSATSLEENLSPFSLVSGAVSSKNNIANLVNDSSKVIAQANQMKSDAETKFLTIPKSACYESLNTGDIEQIGRSIPQSQSNEIAVYNWVKNYRDYFSREFNSMNVVIVMNNSAVYTRINSSSNSSISNLLDLLTGIKAKVTVYTLDDAKL